MFALRIVTKNVKILKYMAGTKVGQLLGGYVYTILDKIEADMF